MVENTGAGASIGAAVTAADADSDTLTYALAAADAKAFDPDPAAGQIRVKDALDFETRSIYLVQPARLHPGDLVAVLIAVDGDMAADVLVVLSFPLRRRPVQQRPLQLVI